MKYKKIPLEVAEEDYDRVMKCLTLIYENVDRLNLIGYDWDGNDGVWFAFGVKFKLGKVEE